MAPVLRAQRVQLKNTWCMVCLRASIHSFDEASATEPFAIQCFLAAEGTKKCETCIQRHSLCQRPCEGMWGDGHDLRAILQWAAKLYSVDDSSYLAANPSFVETVNGAILKLAKAFEHAHSAHASHHGLTGTKKEIDEVCGSP